MTRAFQVRRPARRPGLAAAIGLVVVAASLIVAPIAAAIGRVRADFGARPTSADARSIADWVMSSGDNHGLPFIVIDVAVSSVLMSMGMFMLPPAMISLPFKLLLFVLVDGWSLIVQSLITSFR